MHKIKPESIEALLEEKGWVPCETSAHWATSDDTVYLAEHKLGERLEVAFYDKRNEDLWIATMPSAEYQRHRADKGVDFKQVASAFGERLSHRRDLHLLDYTYGMRTVTGVPFILLSFMACGMLYGEHTSKVAYALSPYVPIASRFLMNNYDLDAPTITTLGGIYDVHESMMTILGGILGLIGGMFVANKYHNWLAKCANKSFSSQLKKDYNFKTGTAALEYLKAQ